MLSLSEFKNPGVKYLFTDIDDTLTTRGQLPAASYEMLWTLHEAGIEVVPVTGRPAGWCDMIARFWPVRGVVGENGAFYFSHEKNKMKRVWAYGEEERLAHLKTLKEIELEVRREVPRSMVSADQFSRLFDLAIDFCEDVPPLAPPEIEKIVEIFKKYGAQAKISSIHVNGWFGTHDKLSMCRIFCKNELGFDIDKRQNSVAFVGDSPNDEPMFAFFRNSFGVANVKDFRSKMKYVPKFVSAKRGAEGFVEIGNALMTRFYSAD